ncbi:hypothetical protein BJY52DRAFT_223343 [Lactarius psammicola]|nr:hypothetical protein BJY52DRAFT_223343 [Lactarius psammicola]
MWIIGTDRQTGSSFYWPFLVDSGYIHRHQLLPEFTARPRHHRCIITQSLLAQIFQQLLNVTTGGISTAVSTVHPYKVHSPLRHRRCLSTRSGVSASCSVSRALVGTLLQQWARRYSQMIQKAQRTSRPCTYQRIFCEGPASLPLSRCYPSFFSDVLSPYASTEFYCLAILPLLNTTESLEIIDELWDTPNNDVALSIRCSVVVVADSMISPPRVSWTTF